jgi:hypothetical protein
MLGGVCPDGGSSSSAPGGGSASVGSDGGMVDAVEGEPGTAGNGGALGGAIGVGASGGDPVARSWTAAGGLVEGVMGPALTGVQFFNCAGVSVSTLAPDASRHW